MYLNKHRATPQIEILINGIMKVKVKLSFEDEFSVKWVGCSIDWKKRRLGTEGTYFSARSRIKQIIIKVIRFTIISDIFV